MNNSCGLAKGVWVTVIKSFTCTHGPGICIEVEAGMTGVVKEVRKGKHDVLVDFAEKGDAWCRFDEVSVYGGYIKPRLFFGMDLAKKNEEEDKTVLAPNSRAPFVVIDDPLAPQRSTNIETILAERLQINGDFKDHAYTSQQLQSIVRLSRNWDELSCPMRESLSMILHKIARIVSGNPCHKDHWDDIAGYATLVAKELGDRK